MRMLGAEVVEVTLGDKILKDAINEALRDWVTNVADTHYLLGTVAGPHPFPAMVRDFQKIIGEEAKQQLQDWYGIDHPDAVCACVGGGSNAIGVMNAFLDDERVNLYGYEAGGNGPASGIMRSVSHRAPDSLACSRVPRATCWRPMKDRLSTRIRFRPVSITLPSAPSTLGSRRSGA